MQTHTPYAHLKWAQSATNYCEIPGLYVLRPTVKPQGSKCYTSYYESPGL